MRVGKLDASARSTGAQPPVLLGFPAWRKSCMWCCLTHQCRGAMMRYQSSHVALLPSLRPACGCALVALLALASPTPANAALLIRADATGSDAGFVPAFWGVQFLSGDGYILSATFSLTASSYFDFDGSLFLNDTFPPGIPGVEPIVGPMSGLSAGDITYPTAAAVNGYCAGDASPCVGRPTTLTFTFAPNSFTAGDWFRFSADVDGGGASGGSFGALGALFDVTMSSGENFSAPFVTVNNNRSEANMRGVPTPATLPLFATGLGLLGWFGWRRRRSRAALHT